MNWLTAKVAQGIALALLIVCMGLGTKACTLSRELKTATAERDTAQAQRKTAETERDSWKAKTADALAANEAYGAVLAQMRAAEEARQRQEADNAARATRLVAQAQQEAAKAKRERDAYAKRFANKPATCAAALDAMEAACPTLSEGY